MLGRCWCDLTSGILRRLLDAVCLLSMLATSATIEFLASSRFTYFFDDLLDDRRVWHVPVELLVELDLSRGIVEEFVVFLC